MEKDDIQTVEDESATKKEPLDASNSTEQQGEEASTKKNDQTESDKDEVTNESKDKPKKFKNPDDSDESDDDEKAEKNSLDKSFDLSTDEEDEDGDHDVGGKENNQESEYLDDLMSKKQTEDETAAALLGDKEGEAKVSGDVAGKDEKEKSEAQKRKNQGIDSSNKELARKRKLEQLEEENKKMQYGIF